MCFYLGLKEVFPVWALSSHNMTLPSLTIRAVLFSLTGQITMRYGRTVLVTRIASHWERRSYTSSWTLWSGSEVDKEWLRQKVRKKKTTKREIRLEIMVTQDSIRRWGEWKWKNLWEEKNKRLNKSNLVMNGTGNKQGGKESKCGWK